MEGRAGVSPMPMSCAMEGGVVGEKRARIALVPKPRVNLTRFHIP